MDGMSHRREEPIPRRPYSVRGLHNTQLRSRNLTPDTLR